VELIKYLSQNFYTKEELLNLSQTSQASFADFQKKDVMPKASYKLSHNLTSESFFGEYSNKDSFEYYAKGYTSWLGILQSLPNINQAFSIFKERYKLELSRLSKFGFTTQNAKMNNSLEAHIKDEWKHFLQGIYGTCTKTGLPEEIAAKELAVMIIKPFLEKGELGVSELEDLENAVNLLDKSSSLFAPHERANSSRHKFIDEVRRIYKLKISYNFYCR